MAVSHSGIEAIYKFYNLKANFFVGFSQKHNTDSV